MERPRRSIRRGVGPIIREDDLPDYGRAYGGNLRAAPNEYVPGDLAPIPLDMNPENRHGEFMDELRARRRREGPQRLAKGGKVRGCGAALRGKTRGKIC